MRKIIEREVISNYKIRFRDINIPLIAYSRDKNNIAPLTGIKKKKDRGFTYWEINIDIETFIKQLSDEELFTALDAQLCDKYR